MKLLCVCLTSSDVNRASRCVRSIDNQSAIPFDYDIKVFVNTVDECYAGIVKDRFGDGMVVVTESNGRPGKGKNSAVNWFIANEQYTHLMIVDGDDFLYPVAFERLDYILKHTDADVIGVQMCDSLVSNEKEHVRRIKIGDDKWLEGWFHEQPNHVADFDYQSFMSWYSDENAMLPFPVNRLMIFNRKAATQQIRLWYSESVDMCDDVMSDFCALVLHVIGVIKYVLSSVTSIYVYDSTCDGVVAKFYSTGNWAKEMGILHAEITPYVKMIGDKSFDTIPFITVPDTFDWSKKDEFILSNLVE